LYDLGMDSAHVAAVRAFNRDYTRAAGLIAEGLLETPYSLTEARVIYELGAGEPRSIASLVAGLGLDAGYLSRVVSRLEGRGLVTKRPSPTDARSRLLSLTAAGEEARDELARRADEQVRRLLSEVPDDRREPLVAAMREVTGILTGADRGRVVLRAPRPGDLGWIVERHGALYAAEYGWGAPFEALVAGVIADFARDAPGDPAGTAAWIAELGGRRAGSVLCMRDDEETARLRLLLVEPFARGHGIGAALVDECIAFARSGGYARLVLWTNEPLVHARPIYERAGFRLVAERTHTTFGPEVAGQDWELPLR
jgi:DNA-binding MarR family transcriptional regulator/GNAT superfamily N-acetyltransferase